MEIGLRCIGTLAPVVIIGYLLDQKAKTQLQTPREILIAPCGMDCAICAQYLARQNEVKKKRIKIPYCTGCRIRGKNCAFIIKHCALLRQGKVKYCFECMKFPCRRLKVLDNRYRKRFHMSMIENNELMKKYGR